MAILLDHETRRTGALRLGRGAMACLLTAGVLAAAVLLRHLVPANNDVSWLLTAAEQVLAGKTLYGDVIETAVTTLQTAMTESKKLPRFTGPIPIVCAGGTAMARNFLPRLQTAIAEAELPVAISEVYLAKDPMNATARGARVGAMLNM